MRGISDLNIAFNIPLPAPALLLHEIPHSDAQRELVVASRQQIRDILRGASSRFLLITGPCSIHDTKAGQEYAARLGKLADRVREKICIVMRCDFEKPRTSTGWKGLITDPHLDGSNDIPEGLRIARRFLRTVIDAGLPTATEFLDPITPQYIADLICWSAIGARTTESQTHRQMASGLSMPVGFKNATTGTIVPAINAIKTARRPQTFLGISGDGVASAVSTTGNDDCHLVLRGGDSGPNYSRQHLAETERSLEAAGLNKAFLVDCSHGNSGFDASRQPDVLRDIVTQRSGGAHAIIGAMLESNLTAGSQPFAGSTCHLVYGQSITDACIDWETTERIVPRGLRAVVGCVKRTQNAPNALPAEYLRGTGAAASVCKRLVRFTRPTKVGEPKHGGVVVRFAHRTRATGSRELTAPGAVRRCIARAGPPPNPPSGARCVSRAVRNGQP